MAFTNPISIVDIILVLICSQMNCVVNLILLVISSMVGTPFFVCPTRHSFIATEFRASDNLTFTFQQFLSGFARKLLNQLNHGTAAINNNF